LAVSRPFDAEFHRSTQLEVTSMHIPQWARSRKRPALLALVLVLLAVVAVLLRPPIAFAGTYTVHTCETPSGTFTGTGGWISSNSPPTAGYDAGSTTPCTTPGSAASLQYGAFGLPVSAGSWLSWDFLAPDSTVIQSYELNRSFNLGWPVISRVANRSYLMQIWHDDDVNAGLLDFKKPLQAGQTLVQSLPSLVAGDSVSWRSLHVSLSCWPLVGSLDCGPFPAQVTVTRAEIGLTDSTAPEGFETGGALTGTDPVRGDAGLSVHAFDTGGGVYRVALSVDGEEVARQVLDDAGGTCADVEPANDDPHEFGTSRPCPLSANATVQLDTAVFRDGQHAVHATVEDAGGNVAVVYDGSVQTHNAPISAVAPGLAGSASVGAQLGADTGQWDGAPTGFDHRWLRCAADGGACTPVAGATGSAYVLTAADAYHRMRVEVTAENDSGAASARSAPTAIVTDAAGRIVAPVGQNQGQGGGGAITTPALGGIQGIINPLGQVSGHVANGSGATAHARIEAAFKRADGRTAHRILVRSGRRIGIVGRLTDASGAGIVDARVGAAWRIVGRDWVARPGVRTGPDGRFVYVLPPGPSRDVRFTYFAFSDSRAVELSNVVRVDARAALTIQADRRDVSGDRVVRLSGRVGAGPIPRAGLVVTLQGFQTGWGWRTFRTVRTDRRGRWSTTYRFRSSRGRFGFRAIVPRQGRFPFASSRSSGVFVVVS
jgi:hypothetical protein